MMSDDSSPNTSPTVSELEKGEAEKVPEALNDRKEEVEESNGDEDRDPRSICGLGNSRRDSYLQPPSLQQTRSRSSARSTRSYTDGYTHWEEKDDNAREDTQEEGREFEVQFDGDSDPWNPKNKPTVRKWCIVLVGSTCSLCVTCASALYTSTYDQMEKEFHISREVATIGLTTYVCGLGLGPMFLSPLSEFYGRRIIYICSFGAFFVWLIACAVAPNIGSMLVFRFVRILMDRTLLSNLFTRATLAHHNNCPRKSSINLRDLLTLLSFCVQIDGLAGSAFLSVAGGTVGDMFTRERLSAPMMVYTASPFAGPELGPLIGGFINQFIDWRWYVSEKYKINPMTC